MLGCSGHVTDLNAITCIIFMNGRVSSCNVEYYVSFVTQKLSHDNFFLLLLLLYFIMQFLANDILKGKEKVSSSDVLRLSSVKCVYFYFLADARLVSPYTSVNFVR